MNNMTPTRLKFVQVATAAYGNGAIITKKQIDDVCAAHNMPVAQWFYTSSQYKVARAMYKLPELGTVMPVVGHSLPMTGNMPTIEPVVEQSDDEIMEEIQNSFMTLNIMAQSIQNGTTTSLIVAGPPSIGKSHTIENVLGEASYDVFYQHGKMSAVGLYKKLYEYREKGQVIVIDDSDELFDDENSLNILKHALDSKENRTITWGNDYKLIDEDGQDIPKIFNYRGSMVFITNLDFYQDIDKGNKRGKHLAALISRSHYLDLELNSAKKMFLHTTNILFNGMMDRLDLTMEQQDELLIYLEINMEQLREVTPRMCIKLAQIIKSGGKRWEKMANNMCLKK